MFLVFPDGSRTEITSAQKLSCGVFKLSNEEEMESPISRAAWERVQAACERAVYPDRRDPAWFQLMGEAYAVGCSPVLNHMSKSTALSLVVDPELPEKKKIVVMKEKLAALPE